MCTNNGGKLEACPSADLLGCCSNTASANGQTVTLETCQYSSDAGTITASTLKQECEQQPGTWTTTP